MGGSEGGVNHLFKLACIYTAVLFQLTKTKTKYIIVVRSTAKLKLNEMNHCSYKKTKTKLLQLYQADN